MPNPGNPATQAAMAVHKELNAMREEAAQTTPPPPTGNDYASPSEVIKRWETIGTEAREAVLRQLITPGDETGVRALLRMQEKRT